MAPVDEIPRDRKSQAETERRLAARFLSLTKRLENVRQHLSADAPSGIGHPPSRLRIRSRQVDANRTSTRRELDRVGQDTREHLLQANRVGDDWHADRG